MRKTLKFSPFRHFFFNGLGVNEKLRKSQNWICGKNLSGNFKRKFNLRILFVNEILRKEIMSEVLIAFLT